MRRPTGEADLEQTAILGILIGAAIVGMIATLAILRRERHGTTPEPERRFAVSTEGQSRCPTCGFANLVTDATCASCGRKLPR